MHDFGLNFKPEISYKKTLNLDDLDMDWVDKKFSKFAKLLIVTTGSNLNGNSPGNCCNLHTVVVQAPLSDAALTKTNHLTYKMQYN